MAYVTKARISDIAGGLLWYCIFFFLNNLYKLYSEILQIYKDLLKSDDTNMSFSF